jgi:hypothetical protein
MRLVEIINLANSNLERCLLVIYHSSKFEGFSELTSGDIKTRLIQTRIPRASKINVSDALNKGGALVDYSTKGGEARRWFLTNSGLATAKKLVELNGKKSILGKESKCSDESEKKVTILFLGVGPADTSRLRLDQEAREIEERIRKADFRDCFIFKSKWAVRVGDFFQYLNETKPDIVHFSGHGSSCGGLAFEDSSGNARIVPAHALVEAFSMLNDHVKIVVLNACHSSLLAKGIATHIDCSIGMLDSIDDESAIQFSAAFYRSLGFGKSALQAYKEARISLIMEGLPGDKLLEIHSKVGIDPDKILVMNG